MPKGDGQVVFNHSRVTRNLAPGVKLQPGSNVVDGDVWASLCENDQRVRDLLSSGENGGLTTKTIKTDALQRLERGESPASVFGALTLDQQAAVAAMITDVTLLKQAQAECRYPQITAILAKRIAALGKQPKAKAEAEAPAASVEDDELVTTRRVPKKKSGG
jgi:hypothetical protein